MKPPPAPFSAEKPKAVQVSALSQTAIQLRKTLSRAPAGPVATTMPNSNAPARGSVPVGRFVMCNAFEGLIVNLRPLERVA